jgi:hypothetical protein
VAERALGKHLPQGADVHHVDLDRANTANSNLVICQDKNYHKLLHERLAALQACGNPNYRQCRTCGQWDAQSRLAENGSHPAGLSASGVVCCL